MHWIERLVTSHTEGKRWSLFTFFCLYIAQTLPSTFFATALQVTMRQATYSLSAIALLQLVKLPWVLKFLWSPLVDKHCTTLAGYRRCIFVSEGIYALLILLAGFLDLHTDLYWIVGLVFLSLVASATQDIATDALAVLTFPRQDKGLVNSMQSLGSFSATLLGSGVLLALLQKVGWHAVLPCLAAFVLLALVPLRQNRQLQLQPQAPSSPVSKADFLWFFTRKSIWPQIGFLLLFYAGLIGSLSILRPYLVDLGYSMKQIGLMSGIFGSAAACVASLLSGFLVRRWGSFQARRVVACCSVLATGYLYVVTQSTPSYAQILVGLLLIWFCYGLSTVVVYTTAMNQVRPGREGTDFTVQTVLTHLSGVVVALISGKVADAFGYHQLFLFETMLTGLSAVYVFLLFKRSK